MLERREYAMVLSPSEALLIDSETCTGDRKSTPMTEDCHSVMYQPLLPTKLEQNQIIGSNNFSVTDEEWDS
jgi:hypothetical protein